MKKILLLIYMSLLPLYSVFGQTQIGVSIHDTTIVAGESVYIPVYVDSSLTGQNVTSFNFEFSFDDYYITIDSLITDRTMTDGWGSIASNLSGNERFSVAGASSGELTGTGILFYLRITSTRNGGSWLDFPTDGNNYFNEGTPEVILDGGYISISSPPSIDISPDNGIIVVGDTKDFNVYGGTSPFIWSVTNPTVASINSEGTVTALNKGTTRIVCTDSTGIVDTTNGVLEVRAFRLSTRDTSFYQGNIIDIPIYSSDLTGLNYTAGQIEMNIDADDLTPIQIITTGTLLENYSSPQFSFIGDNFSVAFAGDTPLSGAGILMIVRFQISTVNTGGTYLNFQNILFNETDLGLGVYSYFDVLPLPTISVSPNTATLIAGQTQTFTGSSGTPPYSWSVSNPTLATISSDGVLTALKGGIITVHVQDTYGGSGNSGNIYLYDTEVTIPDTTADITSSIDLPIYMGTLAPDYSVVSLQTEISFDSSKVHFNQVVTDGTLTSGWSFSVNNRGNSIVIAGAGATGFNTAGTIVKLRFLPNANVVVGNYSNINFDSFMFNEGSPNALTDNGKITFATLAPPVAPSGLTVSLTTSIETQISWVDNSNNENGFAVERATDTTKSWVQIATLPANTTDYVDATVSDGIRYYYRVKAYNGIGNSPYSNTASTVTPLKAPTDLSGTLDGVDNVNLTWTDNSSAESGYIIERHEYTSSFYVLDTVSANVTSYVDSNLIFGEYYTYRVRAFNAIATSDYSNNFDFIVNNPYPNPPSGLSASTIDSSSIGLEWNDNSDNETGFMIERKIGNTGSWTQMYSLPANSTDYTDTGLIDGMLYSYRVNAFNNAGNSAYSNIDSAVTPLKAPTDLSGTLDGVDNVNLTWTDNSSAESGYIIERHEYTSSFYVLDTVSANVTSYVDSNLIFGEYYTYRVRAFNAIATSDYSNNFDFIVNNPYPNPPSGLSASTIDSSSIGLEWNDNSDNETGFMIERKIGNTGSWTQMYSLPANSTDYTDTGLIDGMLYSYRVNAFNNAGNSAYSNIDSAVTEMNSPGNLTATNPEPRKVELSWVDFSESENGFIIERAEGTLGTSLLFTVIDTTSANSTSYIDSNLTSAESYVYQIKAFNEFTQSGYSNFAPVTLVGVNNDSNVPTRYELFQNYPNPFNPSTMIKYSMPENSSVSIVIYSLLGQQVATLFKGNQSAGYHEITWDAANVPSGVYLIYIKFQSSVSHRSLAFTKKAILLK